MDDPYFAYLAALEAALETMWKWSISFGIGWLLLYGIAGPWIKVKLIRRKLHNNLTIRYGPFTVSHLLYTILLVNPWVLTRVLFFTGMWLDGHLIIAVILLVSVYLWLIALLFDAGTTVWIPKIPRFEGFRCRLPLKRWLLAHTAMVFMATGGGIACIKAPDTYEVLRARFFHPEYEYNVDNFTEPAQPVLEGNLVVDQPCPTITFQVLGGHTVQVHQMKGKVVLLDFWATWCGPCCDAVPHLKKAYKKYKDMGLVIFGISLDTNLKELDRYIRRKRISWPQYYDGKGWENAISSHFGVPAIPQIVVIDRQGIVRFTDIHARGLEEALLPLLEQPATPRE